MTSVDACGVTFVSKHNDLPLLTGVLNLEIGCFLVLRKLVFVSFCVVVWVLFSVFSIFCITSLVSATPRNHLEIGFASPKMTVIFFFLYQELYGSIHLRVITDMKFILYVKDYDMWSLNMPLSLTCFHALKLSNIVTKS